MYFDRTSSFGHHHPLGNPCSPVGADAGGNFPLFALMYISMALATCRMLLEHWMVLAWRRALLRAGRRMPISTAMMPITTRSSTSVNARFCCRMGFPFQLCLGLTSAGGDGGGQNN